MNAPARFRDLFNFSKETEVTELYTGLEEVFNRINSFDFDYEADEKFAREKFIAIEQLDPMRPNRVKFNLKDSY